MTTEEEEEEGVMRMTMRKKQRCLGKPTRAVRGIRIQGVTTREGAEE